MQQMPIRKSFLVTIPIVLIHLVFLNSLASSAPQEVDVFDHEYRSYGQLLRNHAEWTLFDYAGLVRNTPLLQEVVREITQASKETVKTWTREQRLAYWINAYNIFTLKAIVNNYPIQGTWFSFSPRNSIKQIHGVWDELTWNAGGRNVTLDQIEHEILRPLFNEPRIHFAINCASVSCPPLRCEPYQSDHLEQQLSLATRDYLASNLGLQVNGSTLHVSSLFDWYGHDFIPHFSHLIEAKRSEKELAILGVIVKYGPETAGTIALRSDTRIRFLRYNWRLNDTTSQDNGQ